MRSIKYGLAAVIPILLVVGWVYGFMYLADYKINVVTATIAAIAVGVGIDYATHFTMRFREEFEFEPSRFPALRRAGEGTGGALAVSALSSIIGFSVMALAPMPIFVTFGVLTAVMISFSLLVALLVLPSVLLVVTRQPLSGRSASTCSISPASHPANTTRTHGPPPSAPMSPLLRSEHLRWDCCIGRSCRVEETLAMRRPRSRPPVDVGGTAFAGYRFPPDVIVLAGHCCIGESWGATGPGSMLRCDQITSVSSSNAAAVRRCGWASTPSS